MLFPAPLLQYLAQVVGRLHIQFFADMLPCAVDIALLLAKDGTDVVLLLVLQDQTASWNLLFPMKKHYRREKVDSASYRAICLQNDSLLQTELSQKTK